MRNFISGSPGPLPMISGPLPDMCTSPFNSSHCAAPRAEAGHRIPASGTYTPEAAYVLASRWELPEEIYVPIRFHHNPERAENLRKESCIVSLAGFLAESSTNKREIKDETLGEVKFAMEELGLSAEQLSEVYQETVANVAA